MRLRGGMKMKKAIHWSMTLLAGVLGTGFMTANLHGQAKETKTAPLVRSAQSGPWSAAATWEGGKVPGSGVRVQVRTGHTVLFDVQSDQVIRSIHVAGTLTFAKDKD